MDFKSVNSGTPAAAVHSSPSSPPPDVIPQRRALTEAIRAINASDLLGQDNELTYVLDRVSHEAVARIVNRKTNEVIMQVPSEYILRLAQEMSQHK
jgi:uncharacterized FlaG/YvyC family protein